MRKLNTLQDVIEALGGIKRVRERFGANRKQAWHWTRTGLFPAYLYPEVQKALKRLDLKADDALFARRRAREAA